MGLLALRRLLSLLQRRRRRRRRRRPTRHFPARSGLIASVGKTKGSPCEGDHDGGPRAGKIARYSIPDLPEDILRHIHYLMPLRDAARAACLSRAFLHSWRCHPNLILNRDTLCLKPHLYGRKFREKIDHILRNHSGCLKKLALDGVSRCHLDSWLRAAVTPGIEELTVRPFKRKYNFPCSVLSDGVRNSLRSLQLGFCVFQPTSELGPLRSLTSLHLREVHIMGDELECLLSQAPGLEQLVLSNCDEIICLKIPCTLEKLSYLSIFACWKLKVIDCKAPNVSTFYLWGRVELSLGETLQMKDLTLCRSNSVHYARAELASIMPNLETLTLRSFKEALNTPMLPTKFLNLKHLTIFMNSGLTFSLSYDLFSLVSFLDASPSLETLVLDVSEYLMKHESVLGGSSHLRQLPEHRHCCLKSVEVRGFSSAKVLVELACYILKNAVSLEYLILDTLYVYRCFDENYTRCEPMSDCILSEPPRALMAIKEFIEDRVPPTVKLTVPGPCERCPASAGWFLGT